MKSSIDRENLMYSVCDSGKDNDAIIKLIKNKHQNEVGIVFCATKNDCESLAKDLDCNNLKACCLPRIHE